MANSTRDKPVRLIGKNPEPPKQSSRVTSSQTKNLNISNIVFKNSLTVYFIIDTVPLLYYTLIGCIAR